MPLDFQIFARRVDLIPTEGMRVKAVSFEELADKDEWNHWHYRDWLPSFRKDGIKHQMKIAPDGRIKNGNFRYWGGWDLGIDFLPLDFNFLLGLYLNNAGNPVIRDTHLKDLPLYTDMFAKNPVIPAKNHVPDPKFRQWGETVSFPMTVIPKEVLPGIGGTR